jgi:hypothetical protein
MKKTEVENLVTLSLLSFIDKCVLKVAYMEKLGDHEKVVFG